MRVLHVEGGMRRSGGAEQVRYLIEGLHARGVDNILVCPPGAEIARSGCPAEVIEVPLAGELDLRFGARLGRVLDARRPNLLHVHSRRGVDLHAGRARRSPPAVVTRRVQSTEPAAWLRLKYRPYRAVIAISSAVEADLIGRVGLDRERVFRIESAVDTARYRPRPQVRAHLLETFDLPADAFIAGVVAQLIARKGHAELLEGFATLVRRHPQARLLCFGRGPLEPQLRRKVAALGLEERVKLVGFREDLPELLPGLDALVHAASREGLGVALLEGASAGVPVAAYAAGGVSEVVVHEENGLLVQPRDIDALARAIERLIADPGLRARLGAAGRARAESRFSVARLAAEHIALYQRVLGSEHGTV